MLFVLDKQEQTKVLIYTNTDDRKMTFLMEKCIIRKQSDFDIFLVTFQQVQVKRLSSVLKSEDYSFSQNIQIFKQKYDAQPSNTVSTNQDTSSYNKIFDIMNYDKVMKFSRMQYKSDNDKEIRALMCIDIPITNIITNILEIQQILHLDSNLHSNLNQFKTYQNQKDFILLQAQFKGVQTTQICKTLSMCYKFNKMYNFDQIQQKMQSQDQQLQFYPQEFNYYSGNNDFVVWNSLNDQVQLIQNVIYSGTDIGNIGVNNGINSSGSSWGMNSSSGNNSIYQNQQYSNQQLTKNIKFLSGYVQLQNRGDLKNFLDMNTQNGIQQTILISFINRLENLCEQVIHDKENNRIFYLQSIDKVVAEKKLSSNTYCMITIKGQLSKVFIDYDQQFIQQAQQILENQQLRKKQRQEFLTQQQLQQQFMQQQDLVQLTQQQIQQSQQQQQLQQSMLINTNGQLANQNSNYDLNIFEQQRNVQNKIQQNQVIKESKVDNKNIESNMSYFKPQQYQYKNNLQEKQFNNKQNEEIIVSDDEDLEFITEQQLQQQEQIQKQQIKSQTPQIQRIISSDLRQSDLIFQQKQSKDLALSSLIPPNQQQSKMIQQNKQGSLVATSGSAIGGTADNLSISNKIQENTQQNKKQSENNNQQDIEQDILSILNTSDDEMDNE